MPILTTPMRKKAASGILIRGRPVSKEVRKKEWKNVKKGIRG
jgi:hypothetical protein